MQSDLPLPKGRCRLFLQRPARSGDRGISALNTCACSGNNRPYPGTSDWVNGASPAFFRPRTIRWSAPRYAGIGGNEGRRRGATGGSVHPIIAMRRLAGFPRPAGDEARQVLAFDPLGPEGVERTASPCWSGREATSDGWPCRTYGAARPTCASRRSISKAWMAASMQDLLTCSAPCITAPTA